MEGGSFVQVSRILAGKPLYVRPSFDFIPQIYPPVYFYISGLVSKVIGNSFLPLRLVSIISTLSILVLIYILVYSQSRSKLGGLLGSGLFCATYELTGYWFDIARVDSLALALLLLSVYLLLKDNLHTSIFGGIALTLACFTKQTMLVMFAIFLIYCMFPLRKNSLVFIGTALISVIGGTLFLDWLHEGWFSYYIFHLPGQHRVISNINTLISSANKIFFGEIVKPILFAAIMGFIYVMMFPGKKISPDASKLSNKEEINNTLSRRAVWLLVLLACVLAICSFWYLASLPSDADRNVIGPYSLERLLLLAGPALLGIFAFFLAIMLKRDPSWIRIFASRLFGKIQIAPRILLAFTLLFVMLIIYLTNSRPELFDGLSSAHLQRISPYLVIPFFLLIVMILSWRIIWRSNRLDTYLFMLLGPGLITISWLGRLNRGGYYNVLMPAFAGISILFGLGIGSINAPSGNLTIKRKVLAILVLLLSSAHLFSLLSSLASQIPTQADKEAGLELVNRIKTCTGNVYIPYHTYLSKMAGKNGYAGVIEISEMRGVFRGKVDPLWYEVQDQIQFSLDTHSIAVVIQDNQVFRQVKSPDYVMTGQVFDDELVFWPVTGWKIRPETIYELINSEGCLMKIE